MSRRPVDLDIGTVAPDRSQAPAPLRARLWPDERRLRELHAAGSSTRTIAETLGTTEAAVYAARSRLGLHVRVPHDVIVALADTGLSTTEVAERLDVTVATVQRVLRAAGKARPRGRPRGT